MGTKRFTGDMVRDGDRRIRGIGDIDGHREVYGMNMGKYRRQRSANGHEAMGRYRGIWRL